MLEWPSPPASRVGANGPAAERSGEISSRSLLERFKPAAPAGVQLFLAAMLWTGVSTFLLCRAGRALLDLETPVALAATAGALALGFLKGAKILRPAARKSARRIEERGDGRCVGGFLSWQSWLFVAGMVLMGSWLRQAGLPPLFLGLLLGGVGTALLWGSLVFWRAWARRLSGRS